MHFVSAFNSQYWGRNSTFRACIASKNHNLMHTRNFYCQQHVGNVGNQDVKYMNETEGRIGATSKPQVPQGMGKETQHVIVLGWNRGSWWWFWGAERTEERSEKWSVFGSTSTLLMLRRCSQRSETTSQQQELFSSTHPLLPPSGSLSQTQYLFSVPHKSLVWGRGGRLYGSRERHGILMGVERVREDRRWWGWMEQAHTQTCTYTQVQQHHCRGLFI